VSRTPNRRYAVLLRQALVSTLIVAGIACASTQHGGSGARNNAPPKFGNGSQTSGYVSQLHYAGTSYYNSYPCATGCPDLVVLEFQPVDDTFSFPWAAAVNAPDKGSVVARVINRSDVAFTDGDFTLEPYNTSNQFAYAWVGHATRSNGSEFVGFGVYTLDGSGKVSGEWSLVASADINICTMANPPSKSAIHRMPPASTNCHHPLQAGASTVTRLASRSIPSDFVAKPRPLAAGLGGLWISCSGGCCQVSAN